MARAVSNYVGTYRRLKMIRQGKTCQIWEAMRDSDNQRCVLKILREDFRKDREELAQLKNEYVVGSELDHEACIRVFEFDTVRGVPFVAIEYFKSLNLKQWLREPDANRAWLPTIIDQAADGIAHLHSKGWIHRDLKPDNLLVNDEARIKLIDFAIGQRIKKGFGLRLGGRGKIAGTRSYMAPEQIRNEPLDVRSDIYSFGCLIFEICSGKLPFTGTNSDELLQRHLKSPAPSLMAFTQDVNPALGDLVAEMMAKRRKDRPASIAEFKERFNNIRLPFGRLE